MIVTRDSSSMTLDIIRGLDSACDMKPSPTQSTIDFIAKKEIVMNAFLDLFTQNAQ